MVEGAIALTSGLRTTPSRVVHVERLRVAMTDLPLDAEFPLLAPPPLIDDGLYHIELVVVGLVQILVKQQVSLAVRHAAYARTPFILHAAGTVHRVLLWSGR